MGLSRAEADVLNNAMPANQNIKLGDKIIEAMGITGGKIFYLDPTHGADSNDGLSPDTAVKSLSIGYGKLRDGYNDTLIYLAGTGSITLSAGFTWSKSYAHFVGACAPVGAGKRCRIFQLSTATAVTLFTISGQGCIFRNIYWFQGVNDATSLINVKVTGKRNYFENCHFAGIGNATQSAAGAASLNLSGAEECKFVNCQIGLDTVTRDADATEILIDTVATRNEFVDCLIYGYISATGYCLVTISGATGFDRYLIFKNCIFMTDSVSRGITMASAFSIPAGMDQGKIILKDCLLLTDGSTGAGDWDSNNRATLWNSAVAPAAAAAGGIATKQ
jgi:hypothetical protein